MYTCVDFPVDFSITEHYDDYVVEIGTKTNYLTQAMIEPAYFDYTSAVTKSLVLINPHLAFELLRSPDWTQFVDDYDEHYAETLGPMWHYFTQESVAFHGKRNLNWPTEPQTLRVNAEIKLWFERTQLRVTTAAREPIPLPILRARTTTDLR